METIYVIVTPQNDVLLTPALTEEVAKQFAARFGDGWRYFPVNVSYIRKTEKDSHSATVFNAQAELSRAREVLDIISEIIRDHGEGHSR